MSKHNKIKEQGDKKLITLVEKLQNEIALQNGLDQNTLDMSDDNLVASKIA